MNRKKNKELNEFHFFVIIAIVIVIGICFNTFRKNSFEEKGVTTMGLVTDIRYTYDKKINLFYKYEVKNKSYTGMTGVTNFYWEDGKRGCIGRTFEITYLPEDPNISDIDLEEYNKYKNYKPSF